MPLQHAHTLGELQARLQHERARGREAQERAHAHVAELTRKAHRSR